MSDSKQLEIDYVSDLRPFDNRVKPHYAGAEAQTIFNIGAARLKAVP